MYQSIWWSQLFHPHVLFLFSLATACNFDNSMCGFTQDKNDTFDWTRNKGGTSSSPTGPSSDHTSGSGRLTKHKTLESLNEIRRLVF